ncbi:MAG: AMP-binding protein, partial [Actinomycetes bacterium]
MIHTSPLSDVAIPDVALAGYVLEQATRLGDKPAMVDGPTGRTLTYAGLAEAVRSLAGGLVEQGFAKGDVLALMAPNLPEYAVVFHAVAMAGGVVTTINPTYTEREVHAQLLDSKARMFVTVAPLLDAAQAAATDTGVSEIHVIGAAPEGSGARPLADLMGPPLAEQVPVTADDVVALPYSSGTMGVNKGVMLTQRNLIANIAQVLGSLELREDEKLIAVLPFFHIYGMQVLMNTGLRAGATVITMPRFDLEQFLQLHADHRITRSFVAPPIVVALAKHPVVDNYDLSALEQVVSGAAPLSAELAIEAGKRLGCEVVQGYGMTELSPVSQLTPPGQVKPGSVGVTLSNTELRIVDPASGEDLAIDADGEIWIRGPQVMKGYLNNPAATASTIDVDGWL